MEETGSERMDKEPYGGEDGIAFPWG